MDNKRIVFLFRDMGTGGAQKIEAFVANTMCDKGHEVIALNMAATPCTVNINPNIRIVNIEYLSDEKHATRFKVLYKLVYLLQIRKVICSLKPDLVCAFLSDVVRIATVALRGTNIPIIGSERGDPYAFSPKQLKRYKNEYKYCKGVIFQLDNVAREYNLPSYVIQKVIPNPCIPRKKEYTPRSEQPAHIVISAGRLTAQKRFDVLIDAFEIVHAQYPEYALCIYGDGPLRTELEHQAQNTSAGSAITFMGDVDDVFNSAKNAEFFVLSSDFEGIPNVILEAMSSGIACVSTDCSPGGARYLLKNGDCGLITPCGDSVKLAEAMIRYIENPELRILHEAKGFEAIKEYAPENIKKMWIDVFEECLR